jgi:hypothetical protein
MKHSYLTTEAAVCLWECLVDPVDSDAAFIASVNKWREWAGVHTVRTWVIETLAAPCSTVARAMWYANERDGCFDYEFCPKFLEHCVSWDEETGQGSLVSTNYDELHERMKAAYA